MKISKWLVSLVLVMVLIPAAFAEEITVTTYYPSPEGKYKKLETTDQTLLATDTASPTARVAVGTTLSVGTTSAPRDSAVLEMNSTSKGFFPPRMTTTERDAAFPSSSSGALTADDIGLTIYNTTRPGLESWDGSDWVGDRSGGPQSITPPVQVAYGTGSTSWTKYTLATAGIPPTATAVILFGTYIGIHYVTTTDFCGVKISTGASGTPAYVLVGQNVSADDVKFYDTAQGTFPVSKTDGAFWYKASSYTKDFRITAVGYYE